MKILREMVRSTVMGTDAIDNVMPYVEDKALAALMSEQKRGMCELMEEAKRGLTREEIAEAEGGKLGKTMLKASSKVNAMLNNDASHIARMLIEGYEIGVVSLQKCVNEMQKEHDEVPPSAKELLKLYDKNVRALRKFL